VFAFVTINISAKKSVKIGSGGWENWLKNAQKKIFARL
jgi:hypothetical protein